MFEDSTHGGRQRNRAGCVGTHHFNSRPHGGRRNLSAHLFFFFIFQLTPSRRATVYVTHWPPCILYFNSRPHGGRRFCIFGGTDDIIISTHALTEGDAFVAAMFSKDEIFQLTPSRRATEQLLAENEQLIISTHALTEGDPLYQDSDENYQAFQLTPSRRATCKFRQIFLLNRGYAYSISLYFLPHFISLLPQILSFQQKPFKFQVRIFLLFSVHLAFALQNQCVHHVKSRFCTNMFYFVFVLFTQIVKSQTISLFIYDFF